MALDPDMLNDYICRRGSSMFHATRADVVPAALAEGLRPGSELGVSSKGGFFKTRNDHVYLCELLKLPTVEVPGPRAYLRIDLSHLDPARLDPDEDQVQQSFDRQGGGWVAEAPPVRAEPEDDDTREQGQALAEWADSAEGFDASEVTAKSLDNGWVSYRGTIPPSAITVVNLPSEGAQLFHDRARQILSGLTLDLAAPPPLGLYKTEAARATALARGVIAGAAESVGESAEDLLPPWPLPEHATTTRDRLIRARRDRSRAGDLPKAEVLHAARQVADAALELAPELGWSATRDACVMVAETAAQVVGVIRQQIGEDAAIAAARDAMEAVGAVPDQS